MDCGGYFDSKLGVELFCEKCASEPVNKLKSRALAAEQERDQLKSELQQARGVAGLKNSSVSLVSEIRHLMEQADILERIEKEKK
jgi:hypothetical protein